MKRMKHLLVILLVIVVSGFLMAGACDDAAEKLCGPCGTIENGDSTITGNAELDGVFKAWNRKPKGPERYQDDNLCQIDPLVLGIFLKK